MTKTFIQEVRNLFLNWLNLPIKLKSYGDEHTIIHPIFNQNTVQIPTYTNGIEWLDLQIYTHRKKYIEYVEYNSVNWDIYGYINMVSPQYRLYFVKCVSDYLSEYDLRSGWIYAYKLTPNPNFAAHLTPKEIVEFFRLIDNKSTEYKIQNFMYLSNDISDLLQDNDTIKITVYRGALTYDATEAYTTDWYINREDAEKASDYRYIKNVVIYEAKINIDDIFLIYGKLDNPKICILDFTKLEDVHQINNIPQFITGIEQ